MSLFNRIFGLTEAKELKHFEMYDAADRDKSVVGCGQVVPKHHATGNFDKVTCPSCKKKG